jgi:hypothetical protein
VWFPMWLAQAVMWGDTVEAAAQGWAANEAKKLQDLSELSDLLERAILAKLPGLVEQLLLLIRERSVDTSDLSSLISAVPPLARVARYGDVRGTKVSMVDPVILMLFERALAALPHGCLSLSREAAEAVRDSFADLHLSLDLLDRPELLSEWQDALAVLAEKPPAHPLLRGYACRLLLSSKVLGSEELKRHTRLAFSQAVPPLQGVMWLEGLLYGSGIVLLQEDDLWLVLDGWLQYLDEDTFVEHLPLLRRAFASFLPGERRMMGEKALNLAQGGAAVAGDYGLPLVVDQRRASQVIPILARILGIEQC